MAAKVKPLASRAGGSNTDRKVASGDVSESESSSAETSDSDIGIALKPLAARQVKVANSAKDSGLKKPRKLEIEVTVHSQVQTSSVPILSNQSQQSKSLLQLPLDPNTDILQSISAHDYLRIGTTYTKNQYEGTMKAHENEYNISSYGKSRNFN